MAQRGRPKANGPAPKKKDYNKLEYWLQPENLDRIEEWCANGLGMDDLAHNMGICKTTLYGWAEHNELMLDRIRAGKNKAIEMVENALFKSALSGNVVAQKFFLTNRRHDKWAERIETNNTNNNTENITITFDD